MILVYFQMRIDEEQDKLMAERLQREAEDGYFKDNASLAHQIQEDDMLLQTNDDADLAKHLQQKLTLSEQGSNIASSQQHVNLSYQNGHSNTVPFYMQQELDSDMNNSLIAQRLQEQEEERIARDNQRQPGSIQQHSGGNQQQPGGNQQQPGGNQQQPGSIQQHSGGNQQQQGGNQQRGCQVPSNICNREGPAYGVLDLDGVDAPGHGGTSTVDDPNLSADEQLARTIYNRDMAFSMQVGSSPVWPIILFSNE